MAGQALYRKYRPNTFAEVVGQDHVVQTILNAIEGGRVAHAYLFSGPRGTGKTTTARLLAKALGCADMDLIEIDAASNNSVEDVRDLREKINFSPSMGTYKVYIVDEVHMLSKSAFNALLKTLEEPPAHAIFVLATTELDRVPATVKSRCQRHTFRRITSQIITQRLQTIIAAEGLTVDPEVLGIVARQATGSMRDAISLLDQLVVDPHQAVTLDRALDVLGAANNSAVRDLIDALATHNSAAGIEAINTAIDAGTDPRQFARQVVDYLRGVLLHQLATPNAVDADADTRASMARHATQLDNGVVVRAMQHFNAASTDTAAGWLTQLPLELALIESLSTTPVSTPAAPAPSAPAVLKLAAPAQPTPAATKVATSEPKTQSAPTAPKTDGPKTDGPKTEAPETDAPTSQEPINITDLNARWKQIQQRSRTYHNALGALMDWFRPLEAENDIVVLGFEKQIFLDKLNSDEDLRQKVERLLAEFVGHPVRVRCVLKSGLSDTPLPDINEEGVVAMGIKLGARPRQR